MENRSILLCIMARDSEHVLLSRSEFHERMVVSGHPPESAYRLFGVVVRYAVQQTRLENNHKLTADDVAYRIAPKAEGLNGWVVSVPNLAAHIPAMSSDSTRRDIGEKTIRAFETLVAGFDDADSVFDSSDE